MSRFIEFLLWLIGFLVVRSLVTGVVNAFKGASEAANTPSAAPHVPGELQSAGELRKDPVCDTYISVPSPWAKLVKGETVYFCSKECRDRFKA
jgi:YHS domain-containing protein